MKQKVGVVSEIWRYPVKSMQGESVLTNPVYWYGMEGDRRYGFVQQENYTTFPWLTGRELPQLVQYKPRFVDPQKLPQSPIEVQTPAGQIYAITDPHLADELGQKSNRPVQLWQLNRGAFDAHPLSLVTTSTLEALNKQFGSSLDVRRFRFNLVLQPGEFTPFVEETWAEGVLTFGNRPGAVRLAVIRRIKRCVMVNINPETAEKDARVLRELVATRDEYFGMYAWVLSVGNIAVNDEVYWSPLPN